MFRIIDQLRRVAGAARSISPARRRYLYRIAAAVVALVASYGVLNDLEALGVLYVVAAVLGVADSNVEPPHLPHEVPDVELEPR